MVEDEHSERLVPAVHRNPFLTLIVILTSLSFIYAITCLEKGHPVYDWIKEWQTLLTGAGAIFAAYATIKQLKLGDTLANKRHETILANQRLPDALLIDRHVPKLIDKIQTNSWLLERSVDTYLQALEREEDNEIMENNLRRVGTAKENLSMAVAPEVIEPFEYLVSNAIPYNASRLQGCINKMFFQLEYDLGLRRIILRGDSGYNPTAVRNNRDIAMYDAESMRELSKSIVEELMFDLQALSEQYPLS